LTWTVRGPYHFGMGVLIEKFPTSEFLELISAGMTEPRALAHLGFTRPTYTQLLIKDADFKEQVEQAKRARADIFYEKIVDSVDEVLDKQEVPGAKLRFEKLKYAAAMDNPERYGEKSKHQIDINMNIFQEMKDLSASDAKAILSGVNPFAAIEAEFTEVEDEDLEDAL
jgi:hypothetical protein